MTISDGHALAQRAVGADAHIAVDENVAEMMDPQPRPDFDHLGNADARQCLHDAKEQPVNFVQEPLNDASPLAVVPLAEAIDGDCPDRLLAEERLGRITFQIGAQGGLNAH